MQKCGNRAINNIRKSAWYREELTHHIGKEVTLECSFYFSKPFSDSMIRLYLENPLFVGSDPEVIKEHGLPVVDHLWVLINRAVKIDPTKPLRIHGIPYEYTHRQGEKLISNVGLRVTHISQNTVTSII